MVTGKAAMVLLSCCCAFAETRFGYRVETIAGSIPDQEGTPALEALFFSPAAIAVADGVLYTSDANQGIRRIDADGLIHRIKPGIYGGISIAADPAGTLYSVGGPELYVRTPAGEIRTFRPLSDWPLRSANLTSVAVAPDGTPVIVDNANRIVARVGRDGSAQPIAGTGSRVALNIVPYGVAIDRTGDIYISSRTQIFRLTTGGVLSLIAGTGGYGDPMVGSSASESPFKQIGSIACGGAGEIYVADGYAKVVLRINSERVIDRIMWEGNVAGLAVDASDTLLVFDVAGQIVRVQSDGTKTILAGRLAFAGDGGPATEALLHSPGAVASDGNGGFFIADTLNNRIRRVSPTGEITTVAGTGVYGSSGDGGFGIDAQIAGPSVLASDGEGNLYFAQTNLRVRKLRPDGIVETVAGTGNPGDPGDGGPAVDATFQSIDGLAIDRFGRLYISDRQSNTVRVVIDGVISRYAGANLPGPGADDVPALDSPLARPTLLSVDASGDLVVFESGALRFRTINSKSGEIRTLAGTSPLGTPAGDGAGSLCVFSSISGMASDLDGNLFIAGSAHVCRYEKESGISSVIAGSRLSGFAGDGGPALDALFHSQIGLATDSTGSLLVADTGNHRIRKLTRTAGEEAVQAKHGHWRSDAKAFIPR